MNPCPQQTKSRSIDSPTAEVIRQFRLDAEELALELAARLRVLGKTLQSACPEQGATGPGPSAYHRLRRQLDGFFASLANCKFPGETHFTHIRSYLQDALPRELGEAVCARPCPIELVDTFICLLTESLFEEDFLADSLANSCSL